VNMSLWRLTLAFLALTATSLLTGCAIQGGYYDEGGYYEPYGEYYGGWGPDYYVVPSYGGEHHHEVEHRESEHRPAVESGHGARTYRAAPASHATPSIPSRPRSGQTRSR